MGVDSSNKEEESLLQPSNLDSNDKKSCISKCYAGSKVVLSTIYTRKGLLLAVIAALINALRSIISKYVVDNVHPLQVACVERTLMLACCVPFLLWKGSEYFKVDWSNLGLIFLSGSSHAFSVIALLFSYQFLEVGYVTAIISTRPAIVGLIGAICLREELSKFDVVSIFLTLIGLLVLARPLDLFLNRSSDSSSIQGFLLATASTLFAASNSIEKRMIGINQIDTQAALFYNALISAAISGIICTIFREWSIPEDRLTGALLLAMGALAYLSNFCTFWALWTETAFHITTIGTIKIPFTFVLQFFILLVAPDLYSIVGAAFVILSTIGIAFQHKTSNN